jgi:hypothetical protein
MSQSPQGPGWWIASDSRWYPPELHPSRQKVPSSIRTTTVEHRRGRWLIVSSLVIVLVVLAALLGVSILSGKTALGTLRAGSGTANVSWRKSSGCVTTFSGTVAGLSLKGTAAGVFPSTPSANRAGCLATPTTSTGTGTLPLSIQAGDWKGTLGGTEFDLKVSLVVSSSVTTRQGTVSIAHITGSFGTGQLRATITASSRNPEELSFVGTVGRYGVRGTVNATSFSSRRSTATFVLTG